MEARSTKAEAPPQATVTSAKGRVFAIAQGTTCPGTWGPESCWDILWNGQKAGTLCRDQTYRAPLAWHANINTLRWSGPLPPPRTGYDVAAFATAKECLDAWARSADEILDSREARGSRSGGDQLLRGAPVRGVHRHEDGLLPEALGKLAGDTFGAAHGAVAGHVHGLGNDLDHVAVFPLPLPHAARADERGTLKGAADERLDDAAKRGAVKGGRKPAKAPGASRDAGTHVKANDARGAKVARAGTKSAGTAAHASRIAKVRAEAEDRIGRRAGAFWVAAFPVPGNSDEVIVETSWLPDAPEAGGALVAAGFQRTKEGHYAARVPKGNRLHVIRVATKAIDTLMTEAWG